MASSSSKMVVLVSSDGKKFEVDEASAVMSEFVKKAMEAGECKILLPKVNSAALAKVVEFCNHHATTAKGDSGKFNVEYFDSIKSDRGLLFDMLWAVHYMKTNELLDMLCSGVAKMIIAMSLEEKRIFFGQENDFTPEEEAAVLEENTWAFV